MMKNYKSQVRKVIDDILGSEYVISEEEFRDMNKDNIL